MDVSKAIDIVEGLRDPNDEYEALEAWQVLVDTDMAWKLQGRIGRTAQEIVTGKQYLSLYLHPFF